jgi:phosphate starvation-inducible PhoH-like protein/PhoH-like ATPase|tara:strand:+ start:678 stop:1358 length:681 start_codon:yes stop_codon:yes gene_type:complete
MSKMKKANFNDMFEFEPQTTNQRIAYDAWDDDDNLVLTGSAGTGKTFVAMYLAIEAVLTKETPYDRVVIVRSVVPTRDMGFLPGTIEEKKEVFETPYKAICNELFGDVNIYDRMIANNQLQFTTTSFIRGLTIDNAVVIVDEMQNLNFHELDSVITRVGTNCRVIFSGDYLQSDFKDPAERDGIQRFLRIIDQLKNFSVVSFNWHDIVRSDFLRDYIMTKEMLGIK